MNTEVNILFSIPVSVKNKKGIFEMFETIAQFPHQVIMVRNGANTVDAHSIMGFSSIDETQPIELIFNSEPGDDLKRAMSKFISEKN